MTAIIRRVKNSHKFCICKFVGAELVPVIVSADYDFLVSFCKAEGYTWYFNLAEDKAISIS